MINLLTRLAALLAVLLLAAAGILLVIGHHPESYIYNYQAEVLGNFAYTFFVAAFILNIIELTRGSR